MNHSLFGKIIIPVISASIGALITFYLLTNQQEGNNDFKADVPVTINSEAKSDDQNNLQETSHNDQQKKEGLISRKNIKDVIPQSQALNTITPEPVIENIQENTFLPAISKADINFPDIIIEEHPGIDEYTMATIVEDQYYTEYYFPNDSVNSKTITDKLALQVSGMSEIALFPYRKADESKIPDFNNMSAELNYDLNDDLSIGLAAGQETFPIYIENNGELEYTASIKWYGVSCRYMGGSLLLPNINPYYQVHTAYTISGPLFKGSAGIIWRPDLKTRLIFGIDGSSLVYKYQGEIHTGEKIGLKYGIEVDF